MNGIYISMDDSINFTDFPKVYVLRQLPKLLDSIDEVKQYNVLFLNGFQIA